MHFRLRTVDLLMKSPCSVEEAGIGRPSMVCLMIPMTRGGLLRGQSVNSPTLYHSPGEAGLQWLLHPLLLPPSRKL